MPILNGDPNSHYVKFLRGSIQAWENLNLTPEKIDNDTLYFIYSSEDNIREGKLYLGQKLISGERITINLEDIGDIYIDDSTIADKQILVYNETSEHWENASLSTIINTAVGEMQGATELASGAAGLVPVPRAGEQNKFLRGDGHWATIELPTFNQDVFSVNNNEVSLQGYGLAQVGAIPIKTNNGVEWTTTHIGSLHREITTFAILTARLNGTNPEPLDPDTIYMVPNEDSENDSNRYNEYMLIGNSLELLGAFGEVNFSNFVTTTTFNTAISDLNAVLYDQEDSQTGNLIPGLISRVETIENTYVTHQQIGDLNSLLLSEGNTTLVEEVNYINERLTWRNIEE